MITATYIKASVAPRGQLHSGLQILFFWYLRTLDIDDFIGISQTTYL